jgi:hypothetical protein
LTLPNQAIKRWTILAGEQATGTDHEVIEWAVKVGRQEEVDHERVVGWNFTAITEQDLEAVEKLWMERAKDRAQLSAECTEDKVEQEAAWCQEPMSSVLNSTANMISICAKSKRWWNAEIEERSKAVGREK